MKFAIFVVMLAVVMGAQSSVLPLWAPQSYTAVHGPTFYTAPHLIQPAIHSYVRSPIVHHLPIVHAAPLPLVAAEGTYVAKTRGSEHIAPLPGHLNSAASINLEPAPGTF